MKRDLWDAAHKCTKCNSLMRKKILKVEGTDVKGWECTKCKDMVLYPKDSQKVLLRNKPRKSRI